jgi:hypothetical protein
MVKGLGGRSAVARVSVEVRRLRAEQIEKSRLCSAPRPLEPHKVIGIGLTSAVRINVGVRVTCGTVMTTIQIKPRRVLDKAVTVDCRSRKDPLARR